MGWFNFGTQLVEPERFIQVTDNQDGHRLIYAANIRGVIACDGSSTILLHGDDDFSYAHVTESVATIAKRIAEVGGIVSSYEVKQPRIKPRTASPSR